MCAEVCDATRRVLSEEGGQGAQDWQDGYDGWDEAGIRGQLEWCRSVCMEGAHLLDTDPDGAQAARACRACARACTDFLGTLTP